MSQKTHAPHDPGKDHGHQKASLKSGVHRDWRFWAVIAMLAGIGIYVLTLDEAIDPDGEQVPAAIDADAAP